MTLINPHFTDEETETLLEITNIISPYFFQMIHTTSLSRIYKTNKTFLYKYEGKAIICNRMGVYT